MSTEPARSPIPARLVVFAKAPIPGQVKTRIAPRLGAEGAAKLHRELVDRTLATAVRAGIGPVELCCAPDAGDTFFAECANRYGVALATQGRGDLGMKMAGAIARGLESAAGVVLIGTDCPALDVAYLRAAAEALAAGAGVVLGPAEDGGYVLIGASRLHATMFQSIEWGGPTVLADTLARLAAIGVAPTLLATRWDVDRPDDVDRYRKWKEECHDCS